ncbi:unnamed protein product, partial [Staurois parvus]
MSCQSASVHSAASLGLPISVHQCCLSVPISAASSVY